MPASYSDQVFLSSDPQFQNRVRQSLINFSITTKGEATTVAYHRERETYAVSVLGNPDLFKVVTAQAVAANSAVIADATVGGTVVLTSANAAAQAALVTDPHIDTAISNGYNSYFRTPAA
jgi:hypothetical protein